MNAEEILYKELKIDIANGLGMALWLKYKGRLVNCMEKYHKTEVKNLGLFDVRRSFDHKVIEKIRNSKSDAEARRILQNYA